MQCKYGGIKMIWKNNTEEQKTLSNSLGVQLTQDEKGCLCALPCSYFAILFSYLTSPKENTRSADRHTLEMYELNLIFLPFLVVKVNVCAE